MGCTLTSQCTDLLANTDCLSSQCACDNGYAGTACTGKTCFSSKRNFTILKVSTSLFVNKVLDNMIVSLKIMIIPDLNEHFCFRV